MRISDEGTLVPYQGTKKKKSSKVDLDSETLRVWNLLMNIDDGGSEEEASEETEKWWAKEREIFFGYVSSFNARMYQIQGTLNPLLSSLSLPYLWNLFVDDYVS